MIPLSLYYPFKSLHTFQKSGSVLTRPPKPWFARHSSLPYALRRSCLSTISRSPEDLNLDKRSRPFETINPTRINAALLVKPVENSCILTWPLAFLFHWCHLNNLFWVYKPSRLTMNYRIRSFLLTQISTTLSAMWWHHTTYQYLPKTIGPSTLSTLFWVSQAARNATFPNHIHVVKL